MISQNYLKYALSVHFFLFKISTTPRFHGAAMGASVSPLLSATCLWRYAPSTLMESGIDDTHSPREGSCTEFTDQLTNIDDNIKWTTGCEVITRGVTIHDATIRYLSRYKPQDTV